MKIGIIGASGKAGSLIAEEAANRGHQVTAIVRDASKVKNLSLLMLEKEVFDLQPEDLRPFDVVVNAFGAAPGQEHLHVEAGKKLIELLKGSDTRLIVVGGAGSLFVDEAHATRLMDTPEFPKEYYATASNQGKNLTDLQQSEGVDWTFISPAAFFHAEGRRTGSYRKGRDRLTVNAKGDSYISYADYAIALVDEIESPAHRGERFSLVGEAE
ncbi:NAD(P)-dependent oxidoreductase [Paenibacillus sp. D51F]